MSVMDYTIIGPEEGGILDPKLKEFLETMKAQNAPPVESLPLLEAREASIENAAMRAGELESVTQIEERIIICGDGSFSVRIFTPRGEGPFPIFIYYHGGGWVLCSVDTHESAARSIANAAGCIVVSVEYRLAPEHKFPIPVEDAYASLEWTYQNALDFNGDPERIAVGGDSAGGNMAAVVCLMARDRGGPSIRHQVLIYPVTNLSSLETESYSQYAEGYFLTRSMMEWFRDCYLRDESDRGNIFASPLLADDLSELPPAHFLMAEFDPLFDEGEAYAKRLSAAGIPVKFSRYNGLIHAFIIMGAILPQTKQAIDEIALELQRAFDS